VTETTDAGPLADLKAKFPNGVWTTRANARLQDALIEGSGLGRLQPAIGWAARMQATDAPEPFSSPRMLLFAGEYPDGWAAGDYAPVEEQADALENGEGPLAEQALRSGLPITVVRTPASEGVEGPLLDETELNEVLRQGRESADRAIDAGADLLLISGLGAGAATAAVAVCSFIAKDDITVYQPQLHAPGGSVFDSAWMGRIAALRDHLAFNRGFKRSPEVLVTRLGGAQLGAMAAAIFTAATRSTPMLIDGPAAMAAMMIARDFGLAAPKWCYAPNRSTHPVVVKLAKQGGLADDLGFELDLPDGLALPLGLDLIQQSLRIAQSLPMPAKEEEPEPEAPAPAAVATGAATTGLDEGAAEAQTAETEPEPEAASTTQVAEAQAATAPEATVEAAQEADTATTATAAAPEAQAAATPTTHAHAITEAAPESHAESTAPVADTPATTEATPGTQAESTTPAADSTEGSADTEAAAARPAEEKPTEA
jgi:nicotinate-nucleotide--dimethylbenzimidazole phosphoribosyltransferase